MSATDIRLAMQANGYSPIPCVGKRPTIPGWQHKAECQRRRDADVVRRQYRRLTAYTPAIDIDITDPEAAALAEEVAKELFGDRGVMLGALRALAQARAAVPHRGAVSENVGLASRRPTARRTRSRFSRDGQQLVCFGTHPDTGEPYTWHGRTPLDTPREELAEVTRRTCRPTSSSSPSGWRRSTASSASTPTVTTTSSAPGRWTSTSV